MKVAAPHDLLWVSGADAVTFLDGLLSQSVADAEPGTVRRSLLLTPRGKLGAPLWLLLGGDRVGIAVEGGNAGAVAESLGRYRIRVDVLIAAEERPITEVWGEPASGLVAPDRWADGATLAADLPLQHGGLRRVITTADVPGPTASESESEAVRIGAGEPRLGVDIGEDTIPQEAGLVDGAVDFDKGCYLGQELVARIDSRGHVNRSLLGLRLERPVAAGAAVRRGAEDLGVVTSAAVSASLGPIALAMLKRVAGPGDEIDVEGVGGVVAGLPLTRNPAPR